MSAAGPAGECLATIVHISDLHIGKLDRAGNAVLHGSLRNVFSNCTWFDGVMGHHARALEDLAEFFWNLANQQNRRPYLFVSGDLTQFGHPDDFSNGQEFVGNQLDLHPPHGNEVGLRCSNWKGFGVPGNHDHWPGRPTILGRPNAAFGQCFNGPFPFVRDIQLKNGRVLQVAGINTDADVGAYSRKRVLAVGSFQRQLPRLARILKRRDGEIRVLLMHHSWHRRGATLAIDRGSRGALEQFLADHGIQIVLTGHTHRSLIRSFVPNVRGAQVVRECRSGTTTQADQVPYTWRNLAGLFPIRGFPENRLLVHRLYDAGGQTQWHVETYYRDRVNGFTTLGPRGADQWIV